MDGTAPSGRFELLQEHYTKPTKGLKHINYSWQPIGVGREMEVEFPYAVNLSWKTRTRLSHSH